MTVGTRISDMVSRAALVAGDLVPIVSGGQNYSFDIGMALGALNVGAFTSLSGRTIPTNTDLIFTSECRAGTKKGRAFYRATPQADSAADIAYATAHPGWTVITANGRLFSLDEEQTLLFEMFGTYGDSDRNNGGGTDDYPQWLIAKDYLQTNKRTHGNPYYKSVPALHFGRYDYRFSQPIDLTEGVYQLIGYGPNSMDTGGNTCLVMDPGVCGIIFQSWDTTGVTGTTTNTPKGSGYSRAEDIDVLSRGGTVGAEQHGFLLKAPATLIRCGAYHFGGHGFLIAADVTHSGNANCGTMFECKAQANGLSGLTTIGGDANAWNIYAFNAIANGKWGIDEESFLENHYYGYHTASNNNTSAGPFWALTRPIGSCSSGTHRYRVVPGQESGASTNAPSGTTANNTWWIYYTEGGASSLFPAWTTAQTWSAGGAFLITGASNRAAVYGGYMESDQLVGLCLSPSARIDCGGLSSFQGVGGILAASNGRLVGANGIGIGPNIGDDIDLLPGRYQFGAECWFARTSASTCTLRGTLDASISLARNDVTHQHAYSVGLPAGIILGSSNAGFTNIASAVPSSGTYTAGAYVRNDLTATTKEKAWRCTAGGTPGTWKTEFDRLYGSTTVDLASVAAGAISAAITITVTGAAVGDIVTGVSTSDGSITLGCVLTGQVTAANTVTAFLKNNSAGAYDAPSATYRAEVTKQ